MKRLILLCCVLSVMLCLYACGQDIMKGGQPEEETESVSPPPASIEPTLEPIVEPTPGLEPEVSPEELAALDSIEVGFYHYDTDVPQSLPDCEEPVRSLLEDIRGQVVDYYVEREFSNLNEYGIPYGLSNIKCYDLPGRDDILVISGDMNYGWPWSCLFRYKDGILSSFSLPRDNYVDFVLEGEEIRLIYHEGLPSPLLEYFSYSHQGNGGFDILKVNGNVLEYIVGGITMGYHDSTWDEKRRDPVFQAIPLEPDEYFCCRYENGHLTPVYEDVNGDGYVDIVLRGAFQCVNSNYDIVASQEVKEVYLYDGRTESYIYSDVLSVRSPLADYWLLQD